MKAITRATYDSPLQRIAALAPSLNPAQLRVLIELVARAERNGSTDVEGSINDLCGATQQARSSVIIALDRLHRSARIQTTPGTATKPAQHHVSFLETIGWSETRTTQSIKNVVQKSNLVRNSEQGGLNFGLPPIDKEQARPRPDRSTDPITDTTDRSTANSEKTIPKTGDTAHDAIIREVLKAKPSDYPADQLSTAGKWIYGYQAKMRGDDPHPPDDKVLACILAATAAWTTKEHSGAELLVYELMSDRIEPGDRYGWYVSVALQRVHGIQPEVWARARAQLRVVNKASISPDAEFSREILAAVAAGVRGMR